MMDFVGLGLAFADQSWLEIYANLQSPKTPKSISDKSISDKSISDRFATIVPVTTIERHRYGGAGWLVWGGIIFGSRTDLHVQSVTMTGHTYLDVILEQHVRLLRGAISAEFLFMDDNARSHCANIVDECFQSEDITRMD
ncbi:transposable element Tcb1 transposase [Trichonephila clavipes]|nr:transposable element Tcb1 transposase [Trichonephila clavipes]